MIKHVIFDFDGTIADSSDLPLVIINELCEKYNCKKLTQDEFKELNNIPIKARFKRLGVPLHKIPQISIDCLIRYRNLMNSLRIFDGIESLIMNLKNANISLSIISSNSVENIREFLNRNKIEVFDNIISAKHFFGKHKSIKRYLKEFKLKPNNVVYVGDELRDIDACRKVGTKIISVIWGYDSLELIKSGNPDYIAYRPDNIINIITSINSE